MKNILIHGDYTQKSYERLTLFIREAKKRDWEIVRINPKDSEDLINKISTQSLFNKERFFVIRGVKLLNKKGLDWLRKNNEKHTGTLVFYQEGNLTQSNIKALPKLDKQEVYSLPKNIFKFLDSFSPGNTKECLYLYHEVTASEPVEFLFSLLSRHIRDLYWVKKEPSTIPYPSWRVAKLERQNREFDINQLALLIRKMARIDVKVKTTKETLTDSLDLLILTNLK